MGLTWVSTITYGLEKGQREGGVMEGGECWFVHERAIKVQPGAHLHFKASKLQRSASIVS